MKRNIEIRQFLRFLAGGVVCALIDVGLMWWLLRLHVAPLPATTGGFAAGLLANFAYHTTVTFNAAFSAGAFFRFMVVVLINYLLTLALVSLAVLLVPNTAADSALLGKIVALPLVALNGYILSKYWIFK
ncbi:MAG: hypothetical protein JWP59_4527 [Massilia sp.]|nr:hypothetical protein [Massilia sp.]